MREVCVIGAGPRGLSVLERLCANADERVRVRVVDPHVFVGGSVWRFDQPTELLMNTVASQVTVFADESVELVGPVVAGPSLYEWARFVALVDPFDDLPEWARREAHALGPDTYSSRAFCGHYLHWVLRHLCRTAPRRVTVELCPVAAVGLRDAADGRQVVTLADGQVLAGLDAVVLTQGHLPTTPTERERDLARYAAEHGLGYVPPGNPADVDLGVLAPDQTVAVRGLGLNFFDHLALLTSGRGGRFGRDAADRLVYHRSGREPRLIAGSRRGVPYHARGANQKGAFGRHRPLFLTPAVIDGLRARAEPVDFLVDVWPLVDHEVRAVYYAALLAERSCTCDADLFVRRYRSLYTGAAGADPFAGTDSPDEDALLDRFGIGRADRWDWRRVDEPHAGLDFADAAAYRDWLLGYLRADLRHAALGNVRGPLKAALDVLRDLRNEVRLVVDHGGLSGDSYAKDLQGWYTPFNAFVSIGPPARRIEEAIALIECGVLEVVGPGMIVDTPADGGGFLVRSAVVPGPPVRATALVEARLPEPDIRRTTDPLVTGLLARGECTTHRIPVRGGGHHETGGLAVGRRPYHLLDADRRPHPRRFAFGVPTETVHWVTAAGIRPGVGSVIVADADAVARACLAPADARDAPDRLAS